jgi:hypothetical protein
MPAGGRFHRQFSERQRLPSLLVAAEVTRRGVRSFSRRPPAQLGGYAKFRLPYFLRGCFGALGWRT